MSGWDRRLTILGIAEASRVAEARELLQNSPESPFRYWFDGEWQTFEAHLQVAVARRVPS